MSFTRLLGQPTQSLEPRRYSSVNSTPYHDLVSEGKRISMQRPSDNSLLGAPMLHALTTAIVYKYEGETISTTKAPIRDSQLRTIQNSSPNLDAEPKASGGRKG